MPHSGLHFLRFWCDLMPKSSILGTPWRPAGPKMAPKIAQVAPKCFKNLGGATPPGPFQKPTCFQDRLRNAPGHHFFGFLMDFDIIFKDFPKF